MKTPLAYQASEYDCGPTTLRNAISYLFGREEISPDLIKYIYMYCLDGFNDFGEIGKSGTSRIAMRFLGSWLNQYRKMRKLPVCCESLNGDEIHIDRDSRIVACLQSGGCAVTRVDLDGGHYVLLTGVEDDKICLFDPYYHEKPYHCKGVVMVNNAPDRMNRKVDWDVMNSEKRRYYALGDHARRECILLHNTATYQPDLMYYI
jgi:hypothetical protein